jgi:short-chain fatty acids transporter
MLKKLTQGSVKLMERFLPDAFIFAVILTIITFVFSILLTGQTPLDMVKHWGGGVWALLTFTMQMMLVLVLGNALAISTPVKNLLKKIASYAHTPGQAILLVTFVSGIACWLNWGFGLIVGALLARELARAVPKVDYRLLIASAYSGFVVWHAGFSASIPLQVNSDLAQLERISEGLITELIPVSRTIFSPANLIVSALIIITLPFLNRAMHPEPEDTITVDPSLLVEDEDFQEPVDKTPAQKLENSRLLSLLVVALSLSYLIYFFWSVKKVDLNLNIVNLIFLMLGVLLHRTPIRYVHAINESIKGAGGVLIQFPFYAGIMGMMTGANPDGVSLATNITNFFLNISTAKTFPLFTYLSAGLVNVFVPSGGGQWAVQGPINMPAAVKLGVDPAVSAMAIAWGDAWTNMIQPFWALPALGIASLQARDIMGYCLMVLFYTGIVLALAFLFLF